MINKKYEDLFDTFVSFYEDTHINPWHQISKKQLMQNYNDVIRNYDVFDDYGFTYLMRYCIKRLSGQSDAHTDFSIRHSNILPFGFKVIGNDLCIYLPNELRGAKLKSINGLPVEKIERQFEDIIYYGTLGRKQTQLERCLKDEYILFSIPFLIDEKRVSFEVECVDGKIERLNYTKGQQSVLKSATPSTNATFKTVNDVLIYNHYSVQEFYREQITKAISMLSNCDLSCISKIVVDLRGNNGGNAELNKPLMDYLYEHRDKRLFAITDARVFSGGRYALVDLLRLGATTIGESSIGTPLNCYGNSSWKFIGDYAFSASSSYLYPNLQENFEVHSRTDFVKCVSYEILQPVFFKPQIVVEKTLEDFVARRDKALDVAINI